MPSSGLDITRAAHLWMEAAWRRGNADRADTSLQITVAIASSARRRLTHGTGSYG